MIKAYVLERCPAALNVGGRCRRLGYRFEWDHYATIAVLTLPDKTTSIVLENHDGVAFLREWQGEDSEPGIAAFPLPLHGRGVWIRCWHPRIGIRTVYGSAG